MQIVVALLVLAVAAAAPQYGAPPRGYGAPQAGGRVGPGPQGSVYGGQGGAAARSRDAQARTLSEENVNNGDGTYRFSFETDNGIVREEEGDGSQVTGSYSYTADDGTPVQISFVADANGFQPEGDALPTPVPTEYPTPQVPLSPEADPSYSSGGRQSFSGRGSASAQAGTSYSAPAAPSRFYGAA